MDADLIDLVAKLVKGSESVPLPGGHGVRFPEVRDPVLCRKGLHCPRYRCAPGFLARAYVCLAFLGKRRREERPAPAGRGRQAHRAYVTSESYFGRGAEKWNGSQWLVHAASWILQRAQELREARRTADAKRLSGIGRRQQWKYLLHALARLAQSCDDLNEEQRDTVRTEWLHHTEIRLDGLVQKWGGDVVPPPLGTKKGIRLQKADARWENASALLTGPAPQSALVQAAYFMHVLHARAGIWQVELDNGVGWRNARQARKPLIYQTLLDLLRHFDPGDPLHEAAERIHGALRPLALFTRAPTMQAKPLLDDLPAPFQPYEGLAAPHLADTASQVKSPAARALLEQAHRLAEVLADLLIDPLHVRSSRAAGPGFTYDDYTYFDSRARYRQYTARGAGRLSTAASSHQQIFRRDMAAYYDHMKSGRLFELVKLHLRDVHRARWPHGRTEARACAVCHVQAP